MSTKALRALKAPEDNVKTLICPPAGVLGLGAQARNLGHRICLQGCSEFGISDESKKSSVRASSVPSHLWDWSHRHDTAGECEVAWPQYCGAPA